MIVLLFPPFHMAALVHAECRIRHYLYIDGCYTPLSLYRKLIC